jgi:hypothetical protein
VVSITTTQQGEKYNTGNSPAVTDLIDNPAAKNMSSVE